MNYSGIEKSAIVLSLMGPELSEKMLRKLPPETVSTLQQDVIPLLDQIQLPEDIDAFVLQEIIQPSPLGQTIPPPEELVEKEETPPETRLDSLSDEEFCELIDTHDVVKCLSAENAVFQNLLLESFSSRKQSAILDQFKEYGLTLQPVSQKNNLSSNISDQIRKAFVERLRKGYSKDLQT